MRLLNRNFSVGRKAAGSRVYMPTILIQSARQIHFLVLIHLVDIVTYKNYPSHFGIGHTSDRFNGQHKNLQACPLRKYLLSLVVLTINNELSQQIYNEKRRVESWRALNSSMVPMSISLHVSETTILAHCRASAIKAYILNWVTQGWVHPCKIHMIVN